jgi:hypothetical protein
LASTFTQFTDFFAELFGGLHDLLANIALRAIRRSYSFQAWITNAGMTAKITRIRILPVKPILRRTDA